MSDCGGGDSSDGGYGDGGCGSSDSIYSPYDAARVKKLYDMSPEDRKLFLKKEELTGFKFLAFALMGIAALASIHPLTQHIKNHSTYDATNVAQCIQNLSNAQSNAFFWI